MSQDDRRSRRAIPAMIAGPAAAGLFFMLGFGASASASAVATSIVPTTISSNAQVTTRPSSQTLLDFKAPSVAVSPGDPRDIVIATRSDTPDYARQIWYSRDGWRPLGRVQVPPTVGRYVLVAGRRV